MLWLEGVAAALCYAVVRGGRCAAYLRLGLLRGHDFLRGGLPGVLLEGGGGGATLDCVSVVIGCVIRGSVMIGCVTIGVS